ncbi:MAG TPA: hypothetical protein VGG43_00495 [Acidimicrobiales bacterium]|jgi:hypothetical protein
MSERMTLAEDKATEVVIPSTPAPSAAGSRVTAAIAEPVVSNGSVRTNGTVSRKVLREERQTRQRIALICGLVIAACIGLTVLVLTLARDRPPGPTPVGAGIVVAHQISILQSLPRPGA